MSHDYEQQERAINRRGVMMLGGAMVGFGVLSARLYYLQVKNGEHYRNEAKRNRTDLEVLLPKRGAILDDNGQVLVDSIVEYDLLLLEQYHTLTTEKIKKTLNQLQLNPKEKSAFIDELLTNNRRPLLILRNISKEQLTRLEFNRPNLLKFDIQQQVRRHYFYGNSISPITGYVGRASQKDRGNHDHALLEEFRLGKTGIEQQYENILHGTSGTKALEVNVYGKRLQELDRTESQAGQDVQLHINAKLQSFAMERLSEHQSGAVIVLDAWTGGVKALASYPYFDANDLKTHITQKKWHALTNDPLKPLVNKTISGLYAPGSTFKPIVALAALLAGIPAETTHSCNGFMQLGKTRFHCWKKHGHGQMNLHQAIQQSCDVWFYQIARKLGINRIAIAARMLGLGVPSGLDIAGEKAGLIPDKAWKRTALDQPFYPGEVAIHGIGQGFILTTPLQLARAYACFINGGKLFTPRLAYAHRPHGEIFTDFATDTPKQISISEQHLRIVRDALIDAVNSRRGTAWRSRLDTDLGFDMAGKTGTIQVRRISKAERAQGIRKDNIAWHLRDHALFAGFAPVHNPRYVVCALVEHGVSGARSAAPIARDIFHKMAEIGLISAENTKI